MESVASPDPFQRFLDEHRAPVLAFSDPQMGERIEALREKGLQFQPRLPRGLDPRSTAILAASSQDLSLVPISSMTL